MSRKTVVCVVGTRPEAIKMAPVVLALRSQGYFDNGPGELSDAASALDWLQLQNQDSSCCWIAGVSFVRNARITSASLTSAHVPHGDLVEASRASAT